MKQEPKGWEKTRQQVLQRDNHECRFCGVSDEAHRDEHGQGLDVHHVIPRADGGNDSPRNLAALCRSCHRTMETLHAQAIGEHVDNYDRSLEGINQIYRSGWERVKTFDRRLAEFMEEHPTFKNELFIYDENTHADTPPAIESDEWGDIVYDNHPIEIDSEFRFAVAYGAKKMLAQVIGEIDGRTGVPFDVGERR